MSTGSRSGRSRARVAIVGGGFAALEAALALRALAPDRTELTLVSPQSVFAYRPAATPAAFGGADRHVYDLRKIADDVGAQFHGFAVEAVSPRQQQLRLASGLFLDYDYLILATGARAVTAVPGAVTFRDQRDISRFRVVLDELLSGALKRLVFAVPSARAWSLPVYELALMSSLRAAEHGVEAEIVIVTPEPRPLDVFGHAASRTVAELLESRRIRFVARTIPHSVGRDGSLAVQFDSPVKADRVVAMPELHGTRIAGIPSSWSGFVPTDSRGRVEGLVNVFAAGDLTTFPIKQGGLAAQEADAAAQAIAAELGAPVKEPRERRVLRARLLTGDGALSLRTELDAVGRPTAATVQHLEARQAEQLKVFGQYLTPYLSLQHARLKAEADEDAATAA